MKLNGLGKAFLGAAGLYAAGKIYEAATEGSGGGYDEDTELLLDAARHRDFALFSALMRRTYPGCSENDVLDCWGLCVRQVNENG